MSPLPFLFKQQLKYYTSHFAQPLPSFSKKKTINQTERQTNKPKNSTKSNQPMRKLPQTTQTTMSPFPELYTLVTTSSFISSFQIQHLKDAWSQPFFCTRCRKSAFHLNTGCPLNAVFTQQNLLTHRCGNSQAH